MVCRTALSSKADISWALSAFFMAVNGRFTAARTESCPDWARAAPIGIMQAMIRKYLKVIILLLLVSQYLQHALGGLLLGIYPVDKLPILVMSYDDMLG